MKELTLDFSKVGDGLNLNDDPLLMKAGQVASGSKNAMLFTDGAFRVPGMLGIKSTALAYSYASQYNVNIWTMKNFVKFDLSESMLILWGKALWSVNLANGGTTQLYDLSTSGKGNVDVFRGKAWACNGSGICKIEGATGYRVGIVAPAGPTATPAAGGSLPDGVYKIYVGYYRKVGGVIVLYSTGTAPADVTLGTGNNKINFTCPRSADMQTSGIVVWMTDAGGSTYYSFYTYDYSGTGTQSFTVSDATAKSISLVYDVQAAPNGLPTNFSWLAFCDNRMWGVDPTIKNRVKYSLKAGTDYDLEKFPGLYFVDYPNRVTALFTLGEHLYVNTEGGLYRQPYGAPDVAFELVDKRYWFHEPYSVAYWGNRLVGLTNDGIRIFDGSAFSDDISINIKPEIEKMYSAGALLSPCGVVHKRDNREEYQIGYQDATVGTSSHNRRLVLNLNELALYGGGKVRAPWEMWDTGAAAYGITRDGVIYMAQNWSYGAAIIYKENPSSNVDKWLYDEAGNWLNTGSGAGPSYSSIGMQTATMRANTWQIVTRKSMASMNSRIRVGVARAIANIGGTRTTVLITMGDFAGGEANNVIGTESGGMARHDSARFDINRWAPVSQSAQQYKSKMPANLKGYSVFITISNSSDYPALALHALSLGVTAYSGRYI